MSDRLALTYVEIDLPKCTRTYSVSPCQAQLGGSYEPKAAVFNGTDTYLKRGGGLTGAVDSKQLTLSFWMKAASFPVGGAVIIDAATALNANNQRTSVTITGTGGIIIQGYNAASALILDQRSSTVLFANQWHHVLASFDLTDFNKRHIYIDDAAAIGNNVTFINDIIDFTMPDWGIGAYPGGSGQYPGAIADLWFAPGVYLDLSVAANRRKFVNANVTPVDLGATGATPTGAAPLIFQSGDVASWQTNKGTGGGFTIAGALTAGIFSTGTLKCFNTPKTCQDRANYNEQIVTLRFAVDTDYLPTDIDCFPFISSHDKVQYTPSVISLGENLGTRSTLAVIFRDGRHSDTGAGGDPYLADRSYNPVGQGSFLGKLRARHPFLRGRDCRLKRGFVGQALADFETRYFKIDSFDGLTPQGEFTIIAKDLFKQLDDDRAQAPALSSGYLSADITSSATAATLLPVGIGNAEYPASGYINIAGNEVVSFTRSGDNLTITRGQKNTVAKSHKAQDRCQLVLSFSTDVATIIKALMVDYGGIDAARIPFSDWTTEVNTFLGNIYTADICEPTGVTTLINELVQQAALAVWPDDLANKIRLQVLRAVPTETARFSAESMLESSLKLKEQPQKRVSRVTVYYARIDPTKPLSNLDNYRSTASVKDAQAEADYGSVALKTITSRWIPEGGRAIAETLANKILGRFRDPPRHVSFETMRLAQSDVTLGAGYRVEHYSIQDATGAASSVPLQVTSLRPGPERFAAEGEEMLWTAPAVDATNHPIVIEVNTFNVNLRTFHDRLYGAPAAGDVVTCTINAGVVIGSHSTSLAAFDVGTWPAGIVPNIVNHGRLQGCGGQGGDGINQNPGRAGGKAFYARAPVNLNNTDGAIWGGGGGGGPFVGINTNAGGGGGAGIDPGLGGPGIYSGHAGTATAGGTGTTTDERDGTSAAGGGPGLPGGMGTGPIGGGIVGGAAGAAIDGISFVTLTGSGDIRGGQIN